MQVIINTKDSVEQIENILVRLQIKKFLLVCDGSFQFLSIKDRLAEIDVPHAVFNEFTPNPLYEDVCGGVDLFNREACDAIVAVGGGSTIDVAKCIKLYCRMDNKTSYLVQEYKDSGVPLIAVPTTAGTGSESTRYAVVYHEGQKQSIAHDSIIPNYAILDARLLKTLPDYQKKCTMLDALCQGIESFWSVNSNEESIGYSKIAVGTIIKYMDSYIFENDDMSAEQILTAANYAGRAINIAQTTAAHAMSYKLTSLYRLPHGHAVSVCLPHVWRYMIINIDKRTDPRGAEHLLKIFGDIGSIMGVKSSVGAVDAFCEILKKLGIENPTTENAGDKKVLSESVNPTRLKNNPVYLCKKTLAHLYENIVEIKKRGDNCEA